ncbi:Rqc2 family fibronectin-binding protein [Athalassotoga saccharophila]|uniref:Rqc2 family fibronectin-binding protein n=1 Tax=Athalassotoga saccharophila TaxID=1441386 RepID=UPI001379D728|nr:NFACT family protein [Athalassotoga saccharophila]BBJ27981.1 fibronectin/fibrinogen-binding protein [Athalassotoga saccharophila]
MPYDSFLVSKLVREIETPVYLTGIYDVNSHSILISLQKRDLLIDAGNWPHFRFTKIVIEKDRNPSAFVSFARSKLKGAILSRVDQIDFDRFVKFDFEVKNLIGEIERFEMYHEAMGSFGNIVLVKDGKILISFRNVLSVKRVVTAGKDYLIPADSRIDPLDVNEDLFINSKGRLDQILVSNVKGFSKKTALELCRIANLSFDTPVESLKIDEIKKIILGIKEMVKALDDNHSYLSIESGIPKDVYAYRPYGNYETFESPSEAIEKLLTFQREESPLLKKDRLLKTVRGLLEKNEEILKKINEELKITESAGEFKKYGELIIYNMYSLPKKADQIKVFDWESGKEILISLDPRKDLAENAQHFFSIYNRLKGKVSGIEERKRLIEKRIENLDQIKYEIENANDKVELDEIERELSLFNYIKTRKSKILQESKPLEYEKDGFKIVVGKNNIQNDRITRQASPDDMWFHVREAPGAHVILLTGKRTPPEDMVNFAASLAAGHSKYRNEAWVDVDYTYVRHVKKPKGAKPGFVIYKNFKTIRVKPIV